MIYKIKGREIEAISAADAACAYFGSLAIVALGGNQFMHCGTGETVNVETVTEAKHVPAS